MIAALLLAVGLGLAGYGALLEWRRSAATEATHLDPPVLPALPPPTRLATSDDFGPTHPNAPATSRRRESIDLVIRVRNLPAAVRDSGGVAAFRAESGADFAWSPFTAAVVLPDGGLELTATLRSAGEFVVAVAATPVFARRGYLARRTVTTSDAGRTVIDVDARSATVGFVLPAGHRRAGPFHLARVGDPRWVAMPLGTTGLSVEADADTQLLLGAGKYELRDPLAPDRVLRFEVPATTRVELSATLLAARSDRP